MSTHTYKFLPGTKAVIYDLKVCIVLDGEKSSPAIDLDRTMPNVELNIFKFQASRLIIF